MNQNIRAELAAGSGENPAINKLTITPAVENPKIMPKTISNLELFCDLSVFFSSIFPQAFHRILLFYILRISLYHLTWQS